MAKQASVNKEMCLCVFVGVLHIILVSPPILQPPKFRMHTGSSSVEDDNNWILLASPQQYLRLVALGQQWGICRLSHAVHHGWLLPTTYYIPNPPSSGHQCNSLPLAGRAGQLASFKANTIAAARTGEQKCCVNSIFLLSGD